ncbi:MAG: GNAT family N-acetyltransferase [Proteiniphilum sp.]|nr:GNAT family N-acetyltransferase [Proteiniphilum sp.]
MDINRITQVNENVTRAFSKLVPQLTGRKEYPSLEELERVIRSENTHLFVATEGDEVMGTLTLVFYQIPSGLKAWIEDVIVNESFRGKGVATALLCHALHIARDKGARKVDLTSAPSRGAANRLYQKLGFEQRETNVYRLYLSGEKQKTPCW